MGEVSHVSINNSLNNTQRVVFFIERVVTKCVFILYHGYTLKWTVYTLYKHVHTMDT